MGDALRALETMERAWPSCVYGVKIFGSDRIELIGNLSGTDEAFKSTRLTQKYSSTRLQNLFEADSHGRTLFQTSIKHTCLK